MTETPQPPYPHYLGQISQDPDKPEIYWLHFTGSQFPYAVPTNADTIKSTYAFLANWIDHHHETQGPWTNWNWVTPRPPWVQPADPKNT